MIFCAALGSAASNEAKAMVLVGETFKPVKAADGSYYYMNQYGVRQDDAYRRDNPYFAPGPANSQKELLLADILHIQRIIQQPALALSKLAPLEAVAKANIAADKRLNEVQAVELALTQTEATHFFPPYRIAALGILTQLDFAKSVARGDVLNDIGPGVRHGELSHRLQWAMIMADYDQAPKSWNFAPYDLFTRIGAAEVEVQSAPFPNGRSDAGGRSIWGPLFDLGGVMMAKFQPLNVVPPTQVVEPVLSIQALNLLGYYQPGTPLE